MQFFFPVCYWQGEGSCNRLPAQAKSARARTSPPSLCAEEAGCPLEGGSSYRQKVKVRRRVRPSLAGQSQKWEEMEQRDTGPYSLAHSRAVEERKGKVC